MRLLTLLALLLLMVPTGAAKNAAVDDFIQRMVSKHDFDEAELRSVLSKARRKQQIIDKISKPAERTLNWGQYRKIFLTEKRVRQGIEFWRHNQQALERAEEEYGVPPQIVVAIIGVETFYGRITGKDRVLDALYTLAFFYPKRSKFFTAELEKFLLLAREEDLDPTTPKGSYAGAMGMGQFMPSSYLAYAVDFDGDGKRDIWHNPTDAIGSVANYFARHGWQPGQPVTAPLEPPAQEHKRFINGKLKPAFTLDELRRAGLRFDPELPDTLRTAIIELETKKGKEYWLGLENFYTITRYNHSPMYAMAAYQLGERILRGFSGTE